MKCVKCGETREVNFYPNNKVRCKACCIRRNIEVYAPRRREKQTKYYKDWYARKGRNRADNYSDIIILWQKDNLEKVRAKDLLVYAVKCGIINRPNHCSICGREAKVNGHHQDYSIPLEVMWVCSSCHKKIHLGIIKT